MAIKLWTDHLDRLKGRLEESLRQSEDPYRWLMRALQEKDPTLTPERCRETMQRWVEQDIKPSGTLLDTVTVASSNYQNAHDFAEKSLRGLAGGNRQDVMNAPAAIVDAWQAIAGLAFALNGGEALLMYQGEVRKRTSQDALNGRHRESREAREYTLGEWASGRYENRGKCADAVYEYLVGKSIYIKRDTIRRWLQGTPEPNTG